MSGAHPTSYLAYSIQTLPLLSRLTDSDRDENTVPFSCAKRLASRNVTSRSASRSRLLPTRMMTMLGLASVRASDNQFASALKVSRLHVFHTQSVVFTAKITGTEIDQSIN